MGKLLLSLALSALLLLGCTAPLEKQGTMKNETVSPPRLKEPPAGQKIPLERGELPKIVEGKGVRGTAKEARDASKEAVANYSDSFTFFIFGNSIARDGKNDETNFWSTLMITPDVVGSQGSFLSAATGTIYTTRSDMRIGQEPGLYLKAIPKKYPLEKDFLDSDKAIEKAIAAVEKEIMKQKNSTGMQFDFSKNRFDITYYEDSIKLFTLERATGYPATTCMTLKGEDIYAVLLNQGVVDCTRLVNSSNAATQQNVSGQGMEESMISLPSNKTNSSQ